MSHATETIICGGALRDLRVDTKVTIVGAGPVGMYAFDAANGKLLWKSPRMPLPKVTDPSVTLGNGMANPRIVPLAWYRALWEEQERVLGPDPWEYGLSEKNCKVLEMLVGYSHEQGLIKKRPKLEDLFLNVDQGRKRGAEYRI